MHTKHSITGSGILVALITIFAVAALLSVVFTVTMTNGRNTRRLVNRVQATTFGQGVIESYFDQWRTQMSSAVLPADRRSGLSTAALTAAITIPPNGDAPEGITLVPPAAPVKAVDPLLADTTSPDGRPIPENGTPAVARTRLNYIATATVRYSANENDVVTVSRVFTRGGRTLFDYFFFGTQPDIEFHPGQPMFPDDIYAGGDLYTAHNNLNLQGDTSFTGKHHLAYSPNDPRNPNIDIGNNGYDDNWDKNNPPHVANEEKLFDSNKADFDPLYTDDDPFNETTWDLKPKDSDEKPNNDGYHELIEEKVVGDGEKYNDPLDIDGATNHRMANNADYRIIVNADDTVSIYKGQSSTPLPGGAESIAIKGALLENRAFQDRREADFVRILDVDISKITKAVNDGILEDSVHATAKDGITLYVTDKTQGTPKDTRMATLTGTTPVRSARSRGIRLLNGARLPSVGLTVASANAIYIQGDYNTGRDPGANLHPPSNNSASYPQPNSNPNSWASTYERSPAAVVGDSVNILSNNWKDSLSGSAKSLRTAAHTTVNAAILAGNVPSHKQKMMLGPGGTAAVPAHVSGSYSGGVENFVRFHESWAGGKIVTIRGTLALLYSSQQARGNWSAADYDPPNRRWFYEPLFQERNPPGFHSGRNFVRGQWLTSK